MPILKKNKKKLKDSSVTDNIEKTVKKKRRFRHKEEADIRSEKSTDTPVEDPEKEIDALLDLLPEGELHGKYDENEEKEWSKSKKRKPLIKREMKGKPIYLEDTGEKLGTVKKTPLLDIR